jgi:hypothetical protein
VFAPYTSINTNLLFFTKGEPTKEIWYYEHPYPEGKTSYSTSSPITIEEFDAEKKWWNKREENEHAWKVSIDEIISRNLDIYFYTPCRVNTVDKELLTLMKRAGCVRVNYGIESGSPRMLKLIKKGITIEQARKAIQAMRPIMDRDIMVFAYHNDKPIGFYINLPEVNEFMQHVGGNMNALGMLRFLYYKLFGKRQVMVGIVFGVDKEYHGRGVEGAMIKYCEEHIVTLNRYHETILTWIGDFNPKMIHIAENLGASLYRKLATYRLCLDKSLPFERHPML